ncbi:MAG: DUF6776 family protein [Marinagarivorans sp.]|nr:DUF6776 family protein [Marinagarivorans sp.]
MLKSRVKASRQHRMVVVRHRPIMTWVIRIGSIALSLSSITGAYQYGLSKGGHNYTDLEHSVKQKNQTIDALETEKGRLQQQLTNIQTGLDIDKQANESVRQQLIELRAKVQNSNAENDMYRSILNPENTDDKKASLDKWNLSAGNNTEQYTFRVIAKKLSDPNDWNKGRVTVKINGEKNGTPSVLNYTEQAVGDNKTLPVRFKYFQTVSGTFALPEGFIPKDVVVTLTIDGKKQEIVTQTYPWAI